MNPGYPYQKLIPCEGICTECNEHYKKMLLPAAAAKNKLCGKEKCKLSNQRKNNMRTHERGKLK